MLQLVLLKEIEPLGLVGAGFHVTIKPVVTLWVAAGSLPGRITLEL